VTPDSRSAVEERRLTPSAIEAVLRSRGVLTTGNVSEVNSSPIGTGQMAESVRLTLRYDGPSDGPPSLVAKSSSKDPGSRAVGRALRAYEVEVGFYRELAPTLGVDCPACYLAEIDLDTGDFMLLLEDLTSAVPGDDLDGCGPDLAEQVLRQCVAFHSARWGDPSLQAIAWLNRRTSRSAAKLSAPLVTGLPSFLDRFGDRLDDDICRGLERAVGSAYGWWGDERGPKTVFHGDLRLDNLMLDPERRGVWVIDWQTVVLGDGVADVSYFLGGCLLPGVRRTAERALVRDYFEGLRRAGVEDFSWDQCWRQYRLGALYGVYLTVGSSMLVEQTDRGDRMFLTAIDRHMRHALELEALDVIEASGD
jgi:Phosphotransferase enzyme family